MTLEAAAEVEREALEVNAAAGERFNVIVINECDTVKVDHLF